MSKTIAINTVVVPYFGVIKDHKEGSGSFHGLGVCEIPGCIRQSYIFFFYNVFDCAASVDICTE